MGSLEQCIKDCDQAVERGRELRLDYKLVGKALTRKANALVRLDRLEEAIETYHKALTEHRYPTHCHTCFRILPATSERYSNRWHHG